MKIATMKKQTLLNLINKCKLNITPTGKTLAYLRHHVALLVPTYIEDHFIRRCRSHLLPRNPGLGMPGRNKCHLPPTKLEFDFSWLSRRVSVEIHGGLKNSGSGHRTEAGVKRDILKCNLAQQAGWFHIQLTTEQVMDDFTWNTQTLPLLELALSRFDVRSTLK